MEGAVYLAFEPKYDLDEDLERYEIHLINTSRLSFLLSIQLHFGERLIKSNKGKIAPASIFHFGRLKFDELNDKPVFTVECWPDPVIEGKNNHLKVPVKPKVPAFFNKQDQIPLLDTSGPLYLLFDNIPDRKQKEPLLNIDEVQPWKKRDIGDHSLMKKAGFPKDIDLHIEKLVSNPGKIPKNEILTTQIKHCIRFLDDALKHNVDRVYIIHGKGDGVLRKRIEKLLDGFPGVTSYNNNYHPNYGHGATEVNF